MKILNNVYTKQDLKSCIHKYKGQLTIFAFLLFGIIVALYLSGYKSPFLSWLEMNLDNTDQIFETFISQLAQIVTNPSSFAFVGLLLAGVIISSLITGGGSGTLFAISIVMVVIFANIFLLPINFIFEEASWGDAEILKYIIAVFMNLLLIMSIISFTRSGET